MRDQTKLSSTQNLIKMAFLSAIAVILMQYAAIKLPMLFPSFLEVDLSEVPALIAILTINPWAGIIVVVAKNILKVLLFGTSTAYVGELANMLVSIGYILPLILVARKRTDMKSVAWGIGFGIVGIAVAGAIVNYFITLPLYAQLYMPMETIIEMGHAIVPAIVDVKTFVLYSIIPFNIFKGIIVAVASIAFIKAIFPMLRYLRPKKTV